MNKNTARMRKLHNGPCAFLIGIATMFLPVYCLAQSSAPVGPVLIGGQPQNQMVVAPGSATFSVTALGTAPITYHWNKNGSPISTTVSKFYSAAFLPREKYLLWLFAAADGRVHMVDGIGDQGLKLVWGSDLTSVKTSCGAGWQVLATSSGEETGDSVRAYEFPDRDPVAVSAAVDFPGNRSE